MVEVITTDEFAGWFRGLDAKEQASVALGVERLQALGVSLGFPHSSSIKGATLALRELRIQSGGKPLRVFYAFDPRRDAVLIIGGDKTGDERFYERMVPLAESIFTEYLREQAAGLHDQEDEP